MSTYPGHPGVCLAGTLKFAGRVFESVDILTESTTTSGLQSHPFKRGEDERGFSDGKTGSQMGRDLPQAPQLGDSGSTLDPDSRSPETLRLDGGGPRSDWTGVGPLLSLLGAIQCPDPHGQRPSRVGLRGSSL